jgi:hypothetical protein
MEAAHIGLNAAKAKHVRGTARNSACALAFPPFVANRRRHVRHFADAQSGDGFARPNAQHVFNLQQFPVVRG